MPITTSTAAATAFAAGNSHVAVLAFPFGTHAAPLLTVINHLAAFAPTTHFSFFSTAKSNTSIFSSKTKIRSNVKAFNVPDGVPECYVFEGKPQEEIGLFVKAAPEGFRRGIEAAVAAAEGREVSCLVTDAFFWFGGEMAEEMGVPWVAFWTAGPSSLSAHLYTDQIRETIGVVDIGGREDEALKFIPGMSKLKIGDLPEGVLFGNLESIFSCMLHQMGRMLPHASAVFINSFQELDLTTTNNLNTKFKKFLNIGPLNLLSPPTISDDAGDCLSWLDNQKTASVAYISFGTVTSPPPTEISSLAEALEDSKLPFIWSLKEHLKANLPNGFLEKTKSQGIVVPWAPQLEVLGHSSVGVFVTHCGWNSVLEGIAGGVPMICRPFFGDQRLNGRVVEDVLEVGEKVEGGIFTKLEVLRCLEMVLLGEKGKKMRENIRGLKELAEKAVGPNGSSSENFRMLLDLVSRPKEV